MLSFFVRQEASPDATAVRGGAGAPAPSSSKPGGNAFPPPVGSFPGDAPNGNGWGARSQSMPRTNGTGGTADGISNYGGGALNRRSNTPGKPPVPGACGLVNVGNTCYLNSAVQCLSHTPLVRAYLLSDMWAAEVNKYNPLGTQVISTTVILLCVVQNRGVEEKEATLPDLCCATTPLCVVPLIARKLRLGSRAGRPLHRAVLVAGTALGLLFFFLFHIVSVMLYLPLAPVVSGTGMDLSCLFLFAGLFYLGGNDARSCCLRKQILVQDPDPLRSVLFGCLRHMFERPHRGDLVTIALFWLPRPPLCSHAMAPNPPTRTRYTTIDNPFGRFGHRRASRASSWKTSLRC